MHAFTGVVAASMLMAATVSAYNNQTIKTVTVTAWSTIDLCPPPTTVTVYDTQCVAPTSTDAVANIIYETVSACQAGQVLTIDGTATTLSQATTLTIQKTISDLVLVPGSATSNDYTATAIIGSAVYSSSLIGNSGQVVTCQTGVTTITSDGAVLTNCPCTVQSTIFEITATGVEAVPTAVVSSSTYIVQIVYIYVIEYIVEQVPTTVTSTVTNTLTPTQTETFVVTTATITNISNPTQIETVTSTITTTTLATPRPTIVTIGGVTFLLQYDTSYDSSASNNLRKRQAISIPGVSPELAACLLQCAGQENCVAAPFDENTSACSRLTQLNLLNRRNAPGQIFAIVIFRPTVSSSSASSSLASSSLLVSRSSSALTSPSGSTRSSVSTSRSPSSPVVSSSRDSTTETTVPTTGTTTSALTSRSNSRSSSRSVLYPISNSSTISTTSSLSSRSSSSLILTSTANSSTIVTSTSATSSSSSTVPVIDPPTTFNRSSSSSSFSTSTRKPMTNSSTTSTMSSTNTSTTSTTLPTSCDFDGSDLEVFTAEEYALEAYDFCSSYISIPAATTTETSTATTYKVTNFTVTSTQTTTTTEQQRDATITDVSTIVETETETINVILFPTDDFELRVAKRYASPEPTIVMETPFASRVATIPATAKSSACSCIQSRIPVSTSTTTVVQPLTLAGEKVTYTSTVEEVSTTQTQNTVTAYSLTTTFTTTIVTATPPGPTCAAVGALCDLESPGTCCSQNCGSCEGDSIPGYGCCEGTPATPPGPTCAAAGDECEYDNACCSQVCGVCIDNELESCCQALTD